MDTTTVMQIIKMIEQEEKRLQEHDDDEWPMDNEYYYGATHTLTNLKEELQSFIEGQLNAVENSTGE